MRPHRSFFALSRNGSNYCTAPAPWNSSSKNGKFPSSLLPSVSIYGIRLALERRHKPWLAGKWSDEKRHEAFEWDTKRDRMRIVLNDRSLTTFPCLLSSLFDEREGYKPADFDKHITVMNDAGELAEIDEDVWLEGMPDHIDFLPHEE